MIRSVVNTCFLIETASLSTPDLTADYRLYSGIYGSFPELHCSVHISMVGNSGGSLSDFPNVPENIFYSARSVKQAVLSVKMQVYKTIRLHQLLHLRILFPLQFLQFS